MTIVLLIVSVLLLVSIYNRLRKARAALKGTQEDLEQLREQYAPVTDIEKAVEYLKTDQGNLRSEIEAGRAKWVAELEGMLEELTQVSSELDATRSMAEMQSFGVYEPHYDFDSSERYKAELDEVRARQKEMIKAEQAAVCTTNWTVHGSAAKGRQMVKRNLKLMLRGFNGECDAAIGKVKYNNIEMLERRIRKAWAAINKLGKSNNCGITEPYLEAKLAELFVTHEFQERKHEEREVQRRVREQMREEERAQREIEKAQAEAEKEAKRSADTLAKARAQLEAVSGKQQEELNAKIALLEERLSEAEANKERAMSRAQMTKSGHVYIISNIGSFGKGVYKIGMTRRLEPMDRVKELGDASVPFTFDVHAMIYSEDAPSLEHELHKNFDARRVNLVNKRKEFFRVSLDEIEAVIKPKHGEVQFTKLAEAEDYNKTLGVLRDQRELRDSQDVASDTVHTMTDRIAERRRQWTGNDGSNANN